MPVKICPACASGNIKVTGNIVASKMMLPGKYECMDCGYTGFPLELDSEEDAEKFRELKLKKKNPG
ncbi:MAG: hypothetical protein JW724_04515 [Candidatus Altiarchaeota archaeon]|nr:hypothetical protein [Candidatus Altiarchaeota archaeon]